MIRMIRNYFPDTSGRPRKKRQYQQQGRSHLEICRQGTIHPGTFTLSWVRLKRL